VASPAPHALLVGAPITVASNLSPAPYAKGLNQLDQLGIFTSSPLVAPDVGVHLQNMQASEILTGLGGNT
jgi:hypothetical protein